jgi:hypothetical protein
MRRTPLFSEPLPVLLKRNELTASARRYGGVGRAVSGPSGATPPWQRQAPNEGMEESNMFSRERVRAARSTTALVHQ